MTLMSAFMCAAVVASSVRCPADSPADSCLFLPKRPSLPMAPPPFPARDDLCRSVTCPRAPNSCYEDSECVFGVCQEPRPRDFVRCDDGNDNTRGDMCYRGQCSGLSVTCPADVEVRNAGGVPTAVEFGDARVNYHDALGMSVTYSHNSGDVFPVGETEVSVEVASLYDPSLTASCSFNVRVFGNDATPCDGFICRIDNVCQDSAPPCKLDGITPTCPAPIPLRDGLYELDNLYEFTGLDRPAAERFPDSFTQHTQTRCQGGQSWCEGPRKLLPVRPPAAMPLPPSFRDFEAPLITTRRPPAPTIATTTTTAGRDTTTPRGTTRAPTTTTTAATTTTTTTTAPRSTTDPRGTTRAATTTTTTTTAARSTTDPRGTTTGAAPATTTTSGSCPAYRPCRCKPGAVPQDETDANGCVSCNCVPERRRRSILAAEEEADEGVAPGAGHGPGVTSLLVAGVAMVAAVVAVVAVGVRRARHAASQRDSLPLHVSASSAFAPPEQVLTQH